MASLAALDLPGAPRARHPHVPDSPGLVPDRDIAQLHHAGPELARAVVLAEHVDQ